VPLEAEHTDSTEGGVRHLAAVDRGRLAPPREACLGFTPDPWADPHHGRIQRHPWLGGARLDDKPLHALPQLDTQDLSLTGPLPSLIF
jgi:hypothetical protein